MISRREFVTRAGLGGSVLFYATLPAPVKAALASVAASPGTTQLNDEQSHTLRGLWDAVVPGLWEGQQEDGGAPGADQAKVQEWMEQMSGSFPWPLNWFTDTFMALWADDLDLWADLTDFWPDGDPKYWELPLSPAWWDPGRQYKIILMQGLFGTLIDLQYQAGITLSKVAFYCDYWYELNEPQTRVGRAYIGWPLPPGTTPYQEFTYNRTLGDHDARLITVNPPRNLVAVP